LTEALSASVIYHAASTHPGQVRHSASWHGHMWTECYSMVTWLMSVVTKWPAWGDF